MIKQVQVISNRATLMTARCATHGENWSGEETAVLVDVWLELQQC